MLSAAMVETDIQSARKDFQFRVKPLEFLPMQIFWFRFPAIGVRRSTPLLFFVGSSLGAFPARFVPRKMCVVEPRANRVAVDVQSFCRVPTTE